MDTIFNERDEGILKEVLKEMGDFEYVTVSALKSHFSIGFPRASRVFKRLQDMGIVVKEKTDGMGYRVIKDKV